MIRKRIGYRGNIKVEEVLEPRENKIKIFLDSGAFSAYRKGVTIDIHKYIDFIKKNEEYLECYANLDVIGDAEASWKNQSTMEKEGLIPLPVYHFEDSWKYLERCLDYDYFALGGMVGYSKQRRMFWLDKCFSKYICGKDNFPKTKVHGFGMTDVRLLFRYPWFSVDSSTYLQAAVNGLVFIPRKDKVTNQYDFTIHPYHILVSEQSKEKGNTKSIHNQNKFLEDLVVKYLLENGTSLDLVSSSYIERERINALFYLKVEAELEFPRKFNHGGIQKGFFNI